jgi:radical SAM superfamily enzyme YgiQ (UPF0313 family)
MPIHTVGLYKEPELMTLMRRAGCRAVFLGLEAMHEDSLAEVNKRYNFGIDYNRVARVLHDHKLGVIASCILGLDSHQKDYHKALIKSLKKAKADFPGIFLMTAWPRARLFANLEKEDRASRDWDRVRKDMPSVQFKHYSHQEIIQSHEKVIRAFASFEHISRVVFRWLFKDRSIIIQFIKITFQNVVFERSKQFRSIKVKSGAKGKSYS